MSGFAYTANYCEENVWHLAGAPALEPGVRRVIVVASLGRVVPVWCQRLAPAPDEPVLWDYHVILAVSGPRRWIYDLDTTLPLPCPMNAYLEQTFAPAREAPPPYRPWFRVIEADDYRRAFASDRAHMRDREGGWLSPPPPWATITGGGAPLLPLARAIDMRDRAALGVVYDLDGLGAALGA